MDTEETQKKEVKAKIVQPFNFKLGADPEFSITMQDRRVHAKRTMEITLKDKKEFKLTSSGFQVGNFGNIGWDGANETAEIRPSPSNLPDTIVSNLMGILAPFCKHMNMFNMSTLSEHASIGGHIHFEIPKEDGQWSDKKADEINRRLASFYLPVMLGENEINLALRIKQGYGALNEYRMQHLFDHEDGNPGYTFEFRCPSAEWMTTPKIATATLAYLGVVYHEILNHPRKFNEYSDVIYKNKKQGDALQMLALTHYAAITNITVGRIKKYVRTFELYQQYKDEIEYILNPKKVAADKMKVDYNILSGWGFQEAKAPSKRDIMSTKKFEDKLKDIDLDQAKNIVNVAFNQDTKVANFHGALAARVAAHKWKLKKSYFLFGMRKGIPEIIARNVNGSFIAGKELIKTQNDLTAITDLFGKMTKKFLENNDVHSNYVIDFKTGKTKSTKEDAIIIGLPYEMRVKDNIKPFLEFIWKIENDEVQPITVSGKEAMDLPNTVGELYKILANKTVEGTPVIFDTGSQSGNRHAATLQDIAMHDPNGLRAEPLE